jgi:hypothetical protein
MTMSVLRLNIDDLVEDLKPVRRMSPRDALMMVMVATGAVVAAVAAGVGLRPDVQALAPHPMVMIRGGMLLLLGFAALSGVVAAARPGVGQVSHGWRWALGAAALFPLTGAALALGNGEFPVAVLTASSGPYCLCISALSAVVIGGAITLWLRRGAPTGINRAGWLVGLAAGSFATFAYSLHCPSDTVYYVGLWYSLAVAISATIGRLIVPRLIRW